MAVHTITGERGDEIRVETGVGVILRLVPKGERNVQVVIDAEHLREEVTAWVDKQGPVWPRVEYAAPKGDAPGLKIWYRVDVHRKAKTDPEIPLADVAKRDKVRDLVGLERPENAPATIEGAAPAPAPAAATAVEREVRDHPGQPAQQQSVPGGKSAPTSTADEIESDVRISHLAAIDDALRDGVDGDQLALLVQNALEVGVSQRSIDAQIRSRREHTSRSVDPATSGPSSDVAARALDDGSEAAGVVRTRGPDPAGAEWLIPAEVDNPQTRGLIERTASPSPAIARAAEEALKRVGVARRALAAAADPDRVGDQAPAPRADEPPPGNGTGNGRRPPVAPVSGLSRRSQPIASDGKPWDFTNTDGRLNLSSYAASAVMDLTNLAGRLLITRARNRHAEDPEAHPLTSPTEQQIYGLASTLLNVADTVQHRAREGGRVDRMAASHRVARQAVREGLDLYPVPWGASADDVAAWRDALIEHGVATINVGLALLAGSAPQQQQQRDATEVAETG